MIVRQRPETLLGSLPETRASIVVVYNRHRNPIAILEELSEDNVLVTTAGDDDFEERLRLSGFVREKAPEVIKEQ